MLTLSVEIKLFFLLVCAIIISIIVFTGCSDPIYPPTEIPLEELLSSPETVEIEDKNIILKTQIYLNLMPIISETPMIVPIYLETIDSSDIPLTIDAISVYVINGNKIWKSYFSYEEPAPSDIKPYRIAKIARNGPYWEPNIFVDVVVALETNNGSYLIIAKDQYLVAVY